MKYTREFLEELYEHKIRKIYTKIELLDRSERVLTSLDGIVIDGNYNVDGSSPVRRNISLTLSIEDRDGKLVHSYLDMSKRVRLYTGLRNYTSQRRDEDIVWFNLGTYVLLDPTYNHSVGELRMTIQGQDKMALMNGLLGGTLSTATSFSQRDHTGHVSSLPWREIFYQAATLFGEEDPGKIVVDEVPDYIYNYSQVKTVAGLEEDFVHVEAPEDVVGERIIVEAWHPEVPNKEIYFSKSDRLYKLSRFGPPDPVVTDTTSKEDYMKNSGEPITSIFDDIVEHLGHTHEYFYSTEGDLVLQKVQTYVNDTFRPDEDSDLGYVSYELEVEDYAPLFSSFPFTYDFSDKESVVSFSSNPSWTNVKNNFVVSGDEGAGTLQIAIDKKPTVREIREWFKEFVKDYENKPFHAELEFLRLDGVGDRMPYDEVTDTVPFLYKERTSKNDAVYVNVPLDRVPWQIALGLKNYMIRNVYKKVGQERVLPRWGREAESMIFKWQANLDRTDLIPNSGIFNPANIYSSSPWLAGYKTLRAAGGVEDTEKLDFGEPLFTYRGDPSFWPYFLDLIDENTDLGKYSIDRIGKRTSVKNSEHASTIFRTNPRNLVVMTEQEVSELGGDKVLGDLRDRGQAYAVIKDSVDQHFLRPEYLNEETKDLFPYHSVSGNPEIREDQHLVLEGGDGYYLVGGSWDGEFSTNYNIQGEEVGGMVVARPGDFVHPKERRTYVGYGEPSEIDFPIGQGDNLDEFVFIIFAKNKEGRFPHSSSTDKHFLGARLVPETGEWQYARKDPTDETGFKIIWEDFEFDNSVDGDAIVAFAKQDIYSSPSDPEDKYASGRINYVGELFNMRSAPLGSMFDNEGAVDCFSELRSLLYQETNFAEVITISTLPIYHLEPNTLIRVEDERSSINGVFMITSFSIPFSPSGADLQTINAVKVHHRI